MKQPTPRKTLAFDFFASGLTQDEPRLIMPNAWFTDIHLPADKYFYEQCFYMQSINGVLTIVWPFEE